MAPRAPAVSPSLCHPRGLQPHLTPFPPASLESALIRIGGAQILGLASALPPSGAILETPSGRGDREPAGALCDSGRSPPLSEPGSTWLLIQGADGRIPEVSSRQEGEPLPCPRLPEREGWRGSPLPWPRATGPARTWLRARRYRALLRPGPPGAQVTRVCATSGGRPGQVNPPAQVSPEREERKPGRGRNLSPGAPAVGSPRRGDRVPAAPTYPGKLSREPGPRI